MPSIAAFDKTKSNDSAADLTLTGGTAMTTVSSGQTLQISGGESSASVIVLSGGTLEVLSGGTANITENSGGIDAIFSGGTAFLTTVSSGGFEYVGWSASPASGGGTAITTTVRNGGTQVISFSGLANTTIVSSGGTQIVNATGSAIGTDISAGGQQTVNSGGTAFRKAARLRAASRSAPTGPSRFETAMFSAVTLRMRVRVLTFTEA